MNTRTRFLAAVALSTAVLGGATAADASGISPIGQFATTRVALRTDAESTAPRAYSVSTVTTQPVVVQARKPQAPSSYELRSLLVRAPVKPEVVRAQGE